MTTRGEEQFKETKNYYVLKIPKAKFDFRRTRKAMPDYWPVKKDKVRTMEQKMTRAMAMIHLKEAENQTYEQIGNAFGVTGKRAWQIIQWGKFVMECQDSEKTKL